MKYILEYNSIEPEYYEITGEIYNKMVYGDNEFISPDDQYFNYKYMHLIRNLKNRLSNISDSEVIKIKKLFPESYFIEKTDIIRNSIPISWRNKKNIPPDINQYIEGNLYSCVINNRKNLFIRIIKNNDEWYLVEQTSGDQGLFRIYYKCDQLSGLMKYLTDLKNDLKENY